MFLAAGLLFLAVGLVSAEKVRTIIEPDASLSLLQVGSDVGARRVGESAQRSESLSSALSQQGQRARQRAQRRMASRGPTEALEDWQDTGGAAESSLSKSELDSMAEGITRQVYGAALRGIVDPVVDAGTSRFVGDDGNTQSSNLIEQAFNKYGLHTSTQTLKSDIGMDSYLRTDASPVVNVIGELRGTDLANEVVVVGAHFDSVNWDDTASKDAPGVDDNGSGTALVQLLAKRFFESAHKPRRTILFLAFNAEEEGLIGSEQFAAEAKSGKYGNVKAAIVADEVAWPGRGKGNRMAIFETRGSVPGTSSLIDTLAHVAGGSSAGDGIRGFKVNNQGFGSDHISFLDKDIPAVLLIERDDDYHADTWGHSAQDTFEHVDFDYGAAMTRLALKVVATLANPAFDAVAPNLVGARISVPNPIGGESTAGKGTI